METIDPRTEKKDFIKILKENYSNVPQSTIYALYRKMKMNMKIPFKELMNELGKDHMISHFPDNLE